MYLQKYSQWQKYMKKKQLFRVVLFLVTKMELQKGFQERNKIYLNSSVLSALKETYESTNLLSKAW